MRLILIFWHKWLISVELDELDTQSRAGCSSSVWACNVIRCIQWRESEIARLREKSRTLRWLRRIAQRVIEI